MRVMISQPMYFPWVGFLAQMALADVCIWLDDAQFSRGSFTNRVQVKTSQGLRWISIPLEGKGSFQPIRDLRAAEPGWSAPHRALLGQALRGRPNVDRAMAVFDHVNASSDAVSLCHTLIASAEAEAVAIGVLPPTCLLASLMGQGGASWDRVLRLVEAVGGTDYLTGHGAIAYLDHTAFEARGIGVSYMDYSPRRWPQAHGAFTPFVTGLDLIASVPDEFAELHLCPATIGWRDFKARKEQNASRFPHE